jgi:hypothetical protein
MNVVIVTVRNHNTNNLEGSKPSGSNHSNCTESNHNIVLQPMFIVMVVIIVIIVIRKGITTIV